MRTSRTARYGCSTAGLWKRTSRRPRTERRAPAPKGGGRMTAIARGTSVLLAAPSLVSSGGPAPASTLSANLTGHAGHGAQTARPGSPGAGGNEPPDEALPVATFGRPAAARGSGSRLERRSANPAGRRAHGEPGFGQRGGRDEPAARVARRRVHHLYGDARSAVCRLRGPSGTAVRRPGCGREHRDGQE